MSNPHSVNLNFLLCSLGVVLSPPGKAMRRREFIISVVGVASVAAGRPFAASAQQDRVRRVAVLRDAKESDADARADAAAFEKALQNLGWILGRSITIDTRWTGGDIQSVRPFAKELLSASPDVLIAVGTAPLSVLRDETRTVPIVFARVSDPVGQGFVANLARPGGNITGFSNFEPAMGGKWLETLKEVAPRVSRVAVIANPASSALDGYFRSVAAASAVLGIEPSKLPVRNVHDLELAIATASNSPNGGAIVPPDALTISNRDIVTARAKQLGLPAIYPFRFFAVGGGLVSYGINTREQFRGAASYVNRILKGEKPADLPVQAPTKYELVVNLRTAKAIGLTIPESFLLRADEVIE